MNCKSHSAALTFAQKGKKKMTIMTYSAMHGYGSVEFPNGRLRASH
jgi:hypothetical protein